MRRKIPITFTVELDQFERLVRLADQNRTNRSLIVRDALERELRRYETDSAGAKVQEAQDAAV
jgi:predicted transcriptional regulator